MHRFKGKSPRINSYWHTSFEKLKTSGGKRCFITYIDVYSRHARIYLLIRSMNKVKDKFEAYKNDKKKFMEKIR